ncbi:MAG: VacJ family lipoprotein [Pseudomonadota bacterium]|nr:VacJ family lipoprotein [Pseudomonadota bacterium]
MRRSIIAVFLIVTAFTASGASSAAPRRVVAGVAVADPWERLNRRGYAINRFLDKILIRPVAMLYRALTPGPIGKGLHNVVTNLGEPLVFINDVLQLRLRRAASTTVRFAFNSTLGLAGLIDVVAHEGIPHHDSTFGDTLGRYGVGPGPYLFIPVIGPSTVRDLLGVGVDTTIDPVHFVNYRYRTEISTSAAVVSGLDTRAGADDELKALLSDAADPYATLRSVYMQYRQSEIDGGGTSSVPPALPPLPEIDDSGAPAPSSPVDVGAPPASQTALADSPIQVVFVRPPFDQPVAFEGLPDQ